jgi:enoyl-CoA hydratase
MLLWRTDIIVAADDATFADPVTACGVNGIECFAHAWEIGHRKAKELLFTGAAGDAAEAYRLGMVNHVVPRDELEAFTLDLAARIADRPAFGLRLAKESVNRRLDAQGLSVAMDSALGLHDLGHAAALARHGKFVDPTGADVIRRSSQNMIKELTA